jgi:hypothetical protein
MRLGRFFAGLFLVIVGGGILIGGLVFGIVTASETVRAGEVWHISNSEWTPVTATVSWSGGTSATQVYLTSGPTTCTNPPDQVGRGVGASGSFASTLKPGVNYALFACTGGIPENATIRYSTSLGLTTGAVAGLVIVGVGATLMVLGRRPEPEDDGTWAPGPAAAPRPRAPAPPPASSPTSRAPPAAAPPVPPPAPKVPATPDGRTFRGCAACGKYSPVGGPATCPYCGTPF